MTYGYFGTMRVQPGKREDVLAILLRASDSLREVGCHIYESRGASALEVLIDNHSESPYQCRVEFCIFCAPAELNELGAMILDWDTGKNLMMEWTVENSV